MAKLTALQKRNRARMKREKHIIACSMVQERPGKDETALTLIKYRDDGEYGGYNEHNIEMGQAKDGALFFSYADSWNESFIYFYPEGRHF